jgi:two-component system phosphate regulon sensor histidine kinase PhoR
MDNEGTILIASPNPELRAACRRALERGNFSIQEGESLQDWAGEEKKENIDVVLLDGKIFQNKREVLYLQDLWEKDANLACILISERESLSRALQAFQAGVCEIVSVPVVPEILSLRVAQAMERRRDSLELKRLHAFEQNFAPLWSVAKGEMATSDLFAKDFLAPAAFRLTMAHEFRAPLTALQSFLLILLKGYVAPEKWREMIQHAYDRSQDLLNLVDDLMNLATATQEMSQGNLSRVRLGDELESILPSLKTEAEQQELLLTWTIQQNPVVMAHAHHLKQVWTNLISNAIKYTPAGGYVRVFLDRQESWAVGKIEDSGIGISPQDLPLIFHEFYRAAEAKKMGVRGTGLGLPLVKRIVEGYGGSLEVQSTVGKGSIFRFRLPMAEDSGGGDPSAGQGIS